MDQQKVANFLKMQRKERGLTQQNVGDLLFVSREAVSKWERAVNLPDYPTMLGLSQLYNLSVNEILAGEVINDTNRDKINSVALKILMSERKKRKKTKIRFWTLIAFILAIFGIIYFIYNYNSLKVYRTYASNDDYYLSQGMFVTSKQRSFIQLGNLYNSHNDTLINQDDIENIRFYYKDNKETKVFIESLDISSFQLDLIEYNRFVKKNNLKKVMQNLYLDIVNKKNEVSTLHFNNVLTYSNNDIIPTLLKGEKAYKEIENHLDIPEIIQKHFKLNNGVYTYELKVDKKTTYHCEYDREEGSIVFKDENNDYYYVLKTKELSVYSNNKTIVYSYEENKCLTSNKDCAKYSKIFEIFKKQILN